MNLRHAAPFGTAVCSGLLWVTVTAAPALAQPKEEPEAEPAAAEAPAAEAAPSGATSTERPQDEASKPEAAVETEAKASGSLEAGASVETTAKAEAKPAEPKPVQSTASAPGAKPDAKATEASQVPLASFEVLPPGAYPEPKVRGIPGGSLRLDMQGWQWPYLPKQAGGPATRVGFSGSVWVDNAWRSAQSNKDPTTKRWAQQGRGVLRLSPTYSWENDWFIQAQGEAVLNSDQTQTQPVQADTDDLWVRFGQWQKFDVQFGRYQGWEVYHLGMGLDLNTFERRGAETDTFVPIQLYNVNLAWDRPNGPGNIAAHIYPLDFLRVEILGQLGNATGYNALAARPAAIVDFGIIKAKGAYEYKSTTAAKDTDKTETTSKGAGGSLQAVFDPWVELGANYGRTITDSWNDRGGENVEGSTTTDSVGGFANGRPIDDLVIGGGANWTRWNNLQPSQRNPGHYEEQTHLQAFGAAQYLLFKTLYIKAVVAYSKAKFQPSSSDPTQTKGLSGRLRVMYIF